MTATAFGRMVCFLIAATGAALSVGAASGAALIYSHSFTGSGDLNGVAPNVGPGGGVTWQSTPGAWNADGTLALTPTQGYNAVLPFVPVNGKRYALSADVNVTAGPGFDLGFIGANPILDTWFDTAAPGPWGWFFRWGNGQVWTIRDPAWGSWTNTGTFAGAVNLKVVLDTNDETLWKAEWFVNDVSMRGPTGLLPSAIGGIANIGFSAHQDTSAGWVDNFMLVDLDAVAPAHPGDFDGDGDVDGADFVAWQTNFPTAGGATLAQGDADGDGDVDGADFVVWQTNFPYTPGPGVSSVPEPTSWILLSLGWILAWRWRRRSR